MSNETGITPAGFITKRLDALLEELDTAVQGVFGDAINLSPQSPDGQINGIIAESNSNLWQLAEACYNAFNPDAVGNATQDNLYQLNGITRLAASSSLASLTVTGNNGTIIPSGSLVSSSVTGNQFSTDDDVTIPISGTITVEASALVTGAIPAPAGTLTEIDTPLNGWLTVNNAQDATLGRNRETNVEFRARRDISVARQAQAILDAIESEIRSVDGVTQTIALENDTNITDSNGIPPHSIYCIVEGGADQDIGEAIFIKKTLGASTFGSTSVIVLDDQDNEKTMRFSRPTEIPIYVIVNLTTFPNYPADGSDQIASAIVAYSQGFLVEGRGFFIGGNVIHSELYTPINTIEGFTVDSLFIGTSPSPTQSDDIVIAIDQASQFVVANITVNT